MSILSSLFGKKKVDSAADSQPQTPAISLQKSPKKVAKRKPKRTTELNRTATISLLKTAIRTSGYKTISVSSLLFLFGYQKRSAENIKQITAWLAEEGLTVHPKLSLSLKASESLRIYSFPVEQRGDLFSNPEPVDASSPKLANQQRERELEEYIKKHEHFRQLGLSNPKRQHSPIHTRDRFDFLCEDEDNTLVVLELKHMGGGKSAVEQVLRYIGMLKQEFPTRTARGILVTGVRDMDTAKALHGMTLEQQKQIEWHLYCFDKISGSLSFELVPYDFIAHHLALAHNL